MKLRGVILCGGQSQRMGTDKGLLLYGKQTWLEIASTKLNPLCSRGVCASVRAAQRDSYAAVADALECIELIEDQAVAAGPMRGLLSAHLHYPGDDLLTLAVDMPDVTPETLEQLAQAAEDNAHKTRPADAIVFGAPQRYEPLCGVYRANGLRRLLDAIHSGELRRHSFQQLDSLLTVQSLALTPELELQLRSRNFPQ